jgi:hypothetical protein
MLVHPMANSLPIQKNNMFSRSPIFDFDDLINVDEKIIMDARYRMLVYYPVSCIFFLLSVKIRVLSIYFDL